MRKAVGPDVAIMVDYNQSLTPAEAVERMRVLDEEGLTWVEEPTLAHDYAGHALVAREAKTPIQCGENWWGALDLQHAIDARRLRLPDARCDEDRRRHRLVMRAAAIASAHGLRVSSHLWPEISAQLLCATPTRIWLEYADWWNAMVAEPLAIRDGMTDLAGATGTGVAWNERAIAAIAK